MIASLDAQVEGADILPKIIAPHKGRAILIDFWATWCGPCKKIAPDVEALAEEYKDQVIIGKCDVDDNDELTGKFGVRNIPTVLFIKDGEVTKAQLEEKIKALL